MKKAKYIRVSTLEQNENSQLDDNYVEYIDKISGLIPFDQRPNAVKLLNEVKNGKVNYIVVQNISRLGRDSFDIQKTINTLIKLKCQVEVLNPSLKLLNEESGKIDSIANLILGVMASIAQIQLEDIIEKTARGIAKAKLNPEKYKGRKVGSKGDPKKILAKNKPAIECFKNQLSISKTAKITGKSYNAIKSLFKILETTNYLLQYPLTR